MTRGCFSIYVRQSRPFFLALPEAPPVKVRKPELVRAAPARDPVDTSSPCEDRQAA